MAAGPSSSSLSAVSKYTSFMLMRVRCVGYLSSVKTEVTLCSSSMSSSSTLRLRIGASFDFIFDEAIEAGIALGLALEVAGIRFPFAACQHMTAISTDYSCTYLRINQQLAKS